MSDENLFEEALEDSENTNVVYALAGTPGFVPGQGGGIVFAACSTGLKRSADAGRSWSDALADLNLNGPVLVTSLAVSPDFEQDGKVFAGAPGGIFAASHGQNWKAILLPAPPPAVSSLAISPAFAQDDILFAGAMEDGVFVSHNSGEHWAAWNFGLLDLHVLCLAISPAFSEDETILAGTESGIFRSANGGRAWREVQPPFGFDAVLSLALSPHYAQDHTLYAGTEEHGLWRSADEGETWTRLAEDDITDPVNAILLADDNSILTVTGASLWHSSDGGATWMNRFPAACADREISALIAPLGFGSGAQALAGFTDGSIAPITLA